MGGGFIGLAGHAEAQPTYDNNVMKQGAPSGATATNMITESARFYDADGANDILGDVDDDPRGDGTTSPNSPLIDAADSSYTQLHPLNNADVVNHRDIGAPTSHNGSLPVEYISGRAVLDGNKAVIEWSVADETDHSHYELSERRSNGWEQIETINGGHKRYQATDDDLTSNARNNGELEWRLESVDNDGTTEVLDEFSVAYTPDAGITAAPNPNPDRIQITTTKPGRVDADLYDTMGRKVADLYDGPTGSDKTISTSMPDVASGAYFIRADGPTTTYTEKTMEVR